MNNVFKILSPIVCYCLRLFHHSGNIVNRAIINNLVNIVNIANNVNSVNIVNIVKIFNIDKKNDNKWWNLKRSREISRDLMEFLIYHQNANYPNCEDLQKCQECKSSASIRANYWACWFKNIKSSSSKTISAAIH